MYLLFGATSTVITRNRARIWVGVKRPATAALPPPAHLSLKDSRGVEVEGARLSTKKAYRKSREYSYYVHQTKQSLQRGEYYHATVTVPGIGTEFVGFRVPDVTARPFRFLLMSCTGAKERDVRGFDRVFERVLGRNPERPDLPLLFGLHLGDNFYAKGGKEHDRYSARMWSSLHATRTMPHVAETFRRMPFLTTWDNHDFLHGSPFGGNHTRRREIRRGRFRKVYWVPGGNSDRGINYSFRCSGATFIVLDTRYYRTREGTGTILGEAQWRWLENTAQNSADEVVFICSSSNIIGSKSVPKATRRRWRAYPKEYNRLAELVAKNNRTVLLSGDIHSCRVYPARELIEDEPTTTCPVVVSSGLGRQALGKPSQNPRDQRSCLEITVDPANQTLSIVRVGEDGVAHSYGANRWPSRPFPIR